SHRGVRSSQATPAAVENSAPLATRPQSTYKLGNVVQTSGATSVVLILQIGALGVKTLLCDKDLRTWNFLRTN
ncbi:MAG: hypothetical protein KBF41_15010, partial [Azonexus sp.]|nr:hypothetical protein [Azonexus sp.]